MTIAEARAALNKAITANDPHAIAAARLSLKKAEEAEDADEAVDGEDCEDGKKAAPPDHEEPDGDEEPSDEDDDEADADGEADDSEDSEDADDAKKSKKMKKGKKSAEDGEASALMTMLGAKSAAEARGKLAALLESASKTEALARDVAKMKRAERRAKVDSLFSAARRAGKVTTAEVDHLKRAFAGKPIAELRAYLEAKPAVASSAFAKESREHVPAADELGILNSPFAQKAMHTFGVTPEQVAKRAATIGISTGFPGAGR